MFLFLIDQSESVLSSVFICSLVIGCMAHSLFFFSSAICYFITIIFFRHVPKYHKWMLDPHLLEMTGSEPLSLEEEIEMQQSWRDDNKKCTFIVLAIELCHFAVAAGQCPPPTHGHGGDEDSTQVRFDDPDFVRRNLHAMVGDVNLFFSEEEEDQIDDNDIDNEQGASAEAAGSSDNNSQEKQLQAELDIMIAEPICRGKGIGKEASCLMMLYGSKSKKIRRYFCKIKEQNAASLELFQKRLGFEQCAYAACFQEYELERKKSSSDEMIPEITQLLGGESFKWQTFSCSLEETKV